MTIAESSPTWQRMRLARYARTVDKDRPIAVGDLLEGKYLVEGELGEGSMGVVFAARHQGLNKRVKGRRFCTVGQGSEMRWVTLES